MDLFDLPLEIFQKILIEAVQLRGIKRAARLRLVNRAFQYELVEALCASDLINECYVNVKKWPWVTRYMERRLCEKRTEAFSLLNTIKNIAELLAAKEGADSTYEEYALQLLELACDNPNQQVRQLLESSKHPWLSFHDDFLAAAIFTGNATLVEDLAEIDLRIHHSAFGDQFQTAVQANNCHILGLLLARVDYARFTLYYAIKRGNLKMVKYLIEAKCDGTSPWINISRVERGTDGQVARRHKFALLSTPNVEIFGIILSELQSRDMLTMLDNDTLRILLLKAVDFGWVSMVAHLILRGAPLDKSDSARAIDPLYQACFQGHYEVVKMLIENGAKPSCSALTIAVKYGHTSITKTLLKIEGIAHTSCKHNLLYVAARKGFLDMVQMLLDAGMDPNSGDDAALLGAVESEHTAMFRMLVERGASVSHVLPEATRRAEAAGLESMLALLNEYSQE